MKLRQHNKKDLHPRKVFHQYFNPHTEEQEKNANDLFGSVNVQPINPQTNEAVLSEVPMSFSEGMSNKEFYAMRRGLQSRISL